METVAFCETNTYARRVLSRHWPGVPIFGDICGLRASDLASPPDVICGGFPCQDISIASRTAAGLSGARSGLWYEMLRLISETRPSWVIAENAPTLRNRGLEECLRGLSQIGYDAEWHCLSAASLGAPHRRDRLWLIAYPCGPRLPVSQREAVLSPRRWEEGRATSQLSWWACEPRVQRVAHGVRKRVDRLRCLGNSVVPFIPEIIGRAILAA